MKAVVFEKPGEIVIREVDEPELGPNDLLVAPRHVGICHSDFDLLAGSYIIPVTFPVVPGHEWSGEVVAVGSEVRGFRPGDRVIGECNVNGGVDHFGFSIDGALAEVFKVRWDWVHKLADEVSYQQGALIEPFSCAYYALGQIGRPNASDTVVVLGGGTIGLSAVAAAAAMGARVILVEPMEHRRSIALSLGADSTIDPSSADPQEALADLTGGRLADVVVEASGNPKVMASAFDLAAHRGRIVFIGINIGDSAPAKLGQIQSKGLRIVGSIGSPDIWPETIRFIAASGIDLSPIVTATFPFEKALDAYEAAQQRDEHIKVHITNLP
ncbi:MAG: zinc-binding dehydrogenase [Actinomycetes bacterium]|nr:alcohol dehydrogenase [Acidimicrobiia bacterium]